MNEIEDRAQKYADKVRERLNLRPIYGVEPIIVSNAHKMGYIQGAEDIKIEYEETVFYLERKLRKWHYIAYDLIAFFVVMILILGLWWLLD